MDKARGILKFAMRMEHDAQQFYTYYEDKLKAPELKQLFGSLAAVEQKHYELVRDQYETMGGSNAPKDISWSVGSDFAAKDPGVLAENADLLGDTETGMSDLMVIRLAFLIEGEFEEFYRSALQQVTEGEAAKVLEQLAGWEHEHKEYFEKQYRSLLKKNWEEAASIILPDTM